jgi:folate-dependent phosphoribosylglycinamide formyltransferase PurN
MERANQHKSSKTSDLDFPIAVLSGGGVLPWIMINAVTERFGPVTIIEEEKEPTLHLVRRRIRLLGIFSTLGQVAFAPILKLLHKRSVERKRNIITLADLDPIPSNNCKLIRVESVNSDECRDELRKTAPKVVLVFGTRMIRKKTLSCIDAPFINYHAGINPAYRGMNGGYWALALGDHTNAGVTVHLIDEGVDTGGILFTAPFKPDALDNFVTYPILQAAAGKPLIIKAVEAALHGTLRIIESSLPSAQWFHPTLWQYLRFGLFRGVW